MTRQRSARRRPATVDPSSRYAFYALLALLFALAVGNLYVLRGFAQLYLGLPLWIWLQIGILVAMLVVAWAAVRILPAGAERTGAVDADIASGTGSASERTTGVDGPLPTGVDAPGVEPTDERDGGTEPAEDA